MIGMVEDKVFILDMRESTNRGIYKQSSDRSIPAQSNRKCSEDKPFLFELYLCNYLRETN